MRIKGRVDTVLSRGKKVISDGTYTGQPGHGRFVPRQLSQALR
jgi:dihydropyrimidinase